MEEKNKVYSWLEQLNCTESSLLSVFLTRYISSGIIVALLYVIAYDRKYVIPITRVIGYTNLLDSAVYLIFITILPIILSFWNSSLGWKYTVEEYGRVIEKKILGGIVCPIPTGHRMMLVTLFGIYAIIIEVCSILLATVYMATKSFYNFFKLPNFIILTILLTTIFCFIGSSIIDISEVNRGCRKNDKDIQKEECSNIL